MSGLKQSSALMLRLIRLDGMLFAAGFAPLLAGFAIRFVVPLGEDLLARYFGQPVLSPYYALFDVFFASLSPAMFCFIAAMVMLEEHDDGIDCYLSVTGLGREGYFLSRIGLPALASFVVTAVLLSVFHLTPLSALMMVLLSLDGALQGVLIALFIVTVSSNKLEGMAVTKLSSLVILGAVVFFFIPKPFCYGFSFLPSFWMGSGIARRSYLLLLLSAALSGCWIRLLAGRVLHKILK